MMRCGFNAAAMMVDMDRHAWQLQGTGEERPSRVKSNKDHGA